MTVSQTSGPGMPRSLKIALGGVAFQALMNALAGVLIFAAASNAADHGQEDGTGLLEAIGVVSIGAAVLLAVCAVLTPQRRSWVRVTVIVIEAVSIAGSVIAVFSGGIVAVAGIGIAAVVIRAYNSADGKAWFAV